MIIKPYERWPGLEDVENSRFLRNMKKNTNPLKSEVTSELKNQNDNIGEKIDSFISWVDTFSCLGDWGCRMTFSILLLCLLFRFWTGVLIMILVLIGSIIGYYTTREKGPKQPVSVTPTRKESMDEILFDTEVIETDLKAPENLPITTTPGISTYLEKPVSTIVKVKAKPYPKK